MGHHVPSIIVFYLPNCPNCHLTSSINNKNSIIIKHWENIIFFYFQKNCIFACTDTHYGKKVLLSNINKLGKFPYVWIIGSSKL